MKLVYTSDTRESWFDLTVFSAAPAYRTTTTAEYVFTQTVSGPFRADYTDHLGAKVTVRFSPNHTSIIKPFIVVEGYNTATIAPHLVGQNNQNNTIGQFLDNITNPFTSPFDLYNSLQQADYDIVYIDFTVGTDDIRRNAALFQEVVVWVNQQKQLTGSTQSNVVMGESMGGLVARYGLARLARNGYNSQTRLLVLHDSPQRGANNPMGLQALTRQADFPVAFLPGNYNGNSNFVRTSDLSDKLKEALAVLDAPATKQLSLKNVTGTDGQYDENTFIDGPYKTMVDFADIGGTPAGFPPIIATSDGSQCGRAQNTPPYQELTRNNQEYILGFAYILRGGIQSEAIANALPAYGTQRTIAHLRVWMTLRVLGGTYTSTLLKRDYPSPANTLPYETLPGGTTNLSEQQDLTGKPIRNTIGFWHFANNTSLYNGDICFVPTYSALDVATVTSATAYAKYINGVTDNPSSPRVASYIAQESVNGSGTQFNQAHIRFTARNSEWLFSKMQNLTLPSSYCSTECDPGANLAISGPITLCGTGTYTSPLQGPNYSYSWAASPAGAFTVSSGTGPTFQTANVTGVNTPGTITLTINTGCQVSFTKAIVIGAPAVPAFVQRDPSDMCYSGTAYYTTTNYDPALTYTIRATGATAIRDPGGFRLKHTGSGYVSFTVTATNSCGTQTANGEVTFDCASAFTYAVYPNPAANTLTVKQNNRAGAAPHNSGKFTVRLHDNHGTLHVQKAANTATLQLAVDTLPAGFYLLRIESEGEAPESHQIQITH